MILAVCFMKINELLSGLWGAGGGLTPLKLTARLSPDGLSAYQLTVSLSSLLCSTPLSSLCFPSCSCGSPKNVVYTTRLGNFLQLRFLVCASLGLG